MNDRKSPPLAVLHSVLLLLGAVTVLLGGSAILSSCGGGSEEASSSSARQVAKFYCPMHPTMVSDHPGDCPICQMRMVPVEEPQQAPEGEGRQPGTTSGSAGAVPGQPGASAPTGTQSGSQPSSSPASSKRRVVYRSTMNPTEVSDRPGKDSMGMDMVPVDVEEDAPAPESAPAGLATVRLSMQKQQLIGVVTSTVERSAFRRILRAVGRVTYDETREKHVSSKTAGYIEKLFANSTAMFIRKGEPLLEIFSPELLSSQQEYLLALEARARTAGSSIPSVAGSGEDLVASARRRLELFDVSEDQIRELETTGKARRTVTVHAPISGFLTHRAINQGDKVEIGTHLVDLTDLSVVWVLASIYEYELPFVRTGQKATMSLPYLPARAFEGRVDLIYPTLDAATRTAQVRVVFANSDLVLKPDMFAEVRLEADLGERVSVPDTAVLETGQRIIVFVAKGDGFFEPREITVGLRLPERYEVLGGLSPGEKVLTSGNFFVDSESKLKAALAALSNGASAPAHQH